MLVAYSFWWHAWISTQCMAIQIAEMDTNLADSLSRKVTSLFSHRNWRSIYKAPQSYRLCMGGLFQSPDMEKMLAVWRQL